MRYGYAYQISESIYVNVCRDALLFRCTLVSSKQQLHILQEKYEFLVMPRKQDKVQT